MLPTTSKTINAITQKKRTHTHTHTSEHNKTAPWSLKPTKNMYTSCNENRNNTTKGGEGDEIESQTKSHQQAFRG